MQIMLRPYQQVAGQYIGFEEHHGALIAQIGKHKVVLPSEMKGEISPHLGKRITILRTDIPGNEYIFRVLADPSTDISQMTQVHNSGIRISEGV